MKKNFPLFSIFLISFLLSEVSFTQPEMNEIYSRGVAGNLDWIEIYNTSETQIDISGYKIYDSGGNSGSKPKKLFPANTIIPAKGFYVIITDTADFDGDLSGFGLSSGGEAVWLEDASGIVIDNITFPAMPDVTQSYGRLPDGSMNWQLLNTITRGSSNGTTDVNDELNLVSEYKLNQNFPNPFNPQTTISYQIAKTGFVSLKVFNILGKEVASLVNENQNAGSYMIMFDGNNLSSGIYFYKLSVGNFIETKKFTLMK